MASPDLVIEATADAAAAAAASIVHERLRAAIDERGEASAAFSGGSTPTPMLAALARVPLPWERVHVFQVDERVAAEGDPARNSLALRRVLLDRVGAHAHLMDVTAPDLDGAAARYGAAIVAREPFDVVHLGIGDDGHTASWPPGDAVIDERDRAVAIVGPFNGHLRMTITPPVVDRARTVVFLVVGASKADALRRALRGDHAVPATRAIGDRTVIVADRAAAGAASGDHAAPT
jgi:6-phosphogluconolactonase